MPFLSPRSLTKSLALLAILCATACQAGAPGSAHSAGRAGEALQFERLMVGSVFGIGSHFESDGRSFTVESFGEGLGNAEVVNLAPRTQAKEQAPRNLLSARDPSSGVGSSRSGPVGMGRQR
jgi:hypothetical protein